MQDLNTQEATKEMSADEVLIREALDELRPTLQRDGGDIELYKLNGDLVVVEMTGACVGCSLAAVTVSGVRKIISEKVGRPMKVLPRSAFIPVRRTRTRLSPRRIQITENRHSVEVPA